MSYKLVLQPYVLVTYKRVDLPHPGAAKYGTLRIEGFASQDYIRNVVHERGGTTPISVRRMDGDQTVDAFTLG